MGEITRTGMPVLPFDWAGVGLPSSAKRSPEAFRAAAEQFEALLLGQMLRSMREAGGCGWLGTGEQEAALSLMEMAEQCLAAALASQGGFGLARLVEQALAAGETPIEEAGAITSPRDAGAEFRSG